MTKNFTFINRERNIVYPNGLPGFLQDRLFRPPLLSRSKAKRGLEPKTFVKFLTTIFSVTIQPPLRFLFFCGLFDIRWVIRSMIIARKTMLIPASKPMAISVRLIAINTFSPSSFAPIMEENYHHRHGCHRCLVNSRHDRGDGLW